MILTGKSLRTLVLIGNTDDAIGGQVVIALLHIVYNGRLQVAIALSKHSLVLTLPPLLKIILCLEALFLLSPTMFEHIHS